LIGRPLLAGIVMTLISAAFWSWIFASWLIGSVPPLWPFTLILVGVWGLGLRSVIRYYTYLWGRRQAKDRERHDAQRLEARIEDAQRRA
jgi:hypothetical protein